MARVSHPAALSDWRRNLLSLPAVLLLLGLPGEGTAQPQAGVLSDPSEIRLWPAGSISPTSASLSEETLPSRGDNVVRITNVQEPSVTLFRAEALTSAPVPAVLVCPGGGYKILAVNIEGTEVAHWLNSIGVTAFVLKYRVPQNREGAFRDAQRAMRMIRHRSEEWGIDPKRVGILGFSAGGHLASRISQSPDEPGHPPVDGGDAQSARPDFAVLVYPAYLASKSGELADDVAVTSQTCPTFLVQTLDDRPHVAGALPYAHALQKEGVPLELHLFPKGGHGYGLRPSRHAVSGWPQLCRTWLEQMGILRAAAASRCGTPLPLCGRTAG